MSSTVKAVSVPNEVIFGWAAVWRVPKKLVAVTELIPNIFVALSPTIFPFAFISPAKVETPVTFKCVVLVIPAIETPYPTVDNLITLDWDCYKIINNF